MMKRNRLRTRIWTRFSSLCLAALFALTLFLPVSSADMDCNIDADTAALIAQAFVADNVSMELGTSWTEDTSAADVVTLYGTDGSPSAYSVELETDGQATGYVVISAYADVENLILEYAEEAEPLYAAFGSIEEKTVIYTGLTGYFAKNENDTYQTLDGEEITKADIGESVLQTVRSPKNYAENRGILSAAENGRALFAEVDGMAVYDPDGFSIQSAAGTYAAGDVEIVDTIAHANQYYQGPFVTYSYRNDWENYATFRRAKQFTSYGEGNCGLVAMTNFVEMFGARFNMSSITSKSYTQLHDEIRQLGIENGWYIPGSGTISNYLHLYFKAVCNKYGIYYNPGSIITKVSTYENVVYQLNNGGPFILSTFDHGYYGDHGVTVYGYIRLVSQSTGWYKSYVKICDGLAEADSGRFIDMSTIATSSTGLMVSWTW